MPFILEIASIISPDWLFPSLFNIFNSYLGFFKDMKHIAKQMRSVRFKLIKMKPWFRACIKGTQCFQFEDNCQGSQLNGGKRSKVIWSIVIASNYPRKSFPTKRNHFVVPSFNCNTNFVMKLSELNMICLSVVFY